MIRLATILDARQILDIYNYYVLNTTVTFDIDPLPLDVFEEKMMGIQRAYPFLVFEDDKEILGYAYGSRFRPKPAYDFVVESTVYVKQGHHGKKIGTQLYKELLHLLKESKLHTVLGVLTVPNDGSIKLHEQFGFKKMGELKEVGFKFGQWQNVGIWQLHLN